MSESEGQPPKSPQERTADLHAVARALRETPHIGRAAKEALADFLDALDEPATTAEAPPPELTDRAAKLLHALRHQRDAGVLADARDRLEEAVLRAESEAPVTTGAFRRLLDALANLGL